MPPGGAGLYFFYTNLWSASAESALFQIRVNGSAGCRAESSGDNVGDEAACGAVVVLAEGKMPEVFLTFRK